MALTPAERAKRYRNKLKLNVEKYEEQRRKQIARVKRGQKKIKELSETEKSKKRKIWREQKKKQREAKKQVEQAESSVTPTTSRCVDYKQKYNNLVKKYNAAVKQLNQAKKTNQRLRKTLSRTKKAQEKANRIIKEETDKIKARQEVLEIALTQKYKDCKSNKQKNILRSIGKSNNVALSRKGVKKIISEGLGLKSSIRFSQTNNFSSKTIEEKLEAFYIRDEISRATSGKRETRTFKKKKMQIRYLTDTLYNLYRIYKEEGGIYSFSTFCKYRPFYVLSPTCASRETCLCVKHSNFDFIVSALKKHTVSILQNKSGKDLLKLVSCDINSQKCMYNMCDTCQNPKIDFTAEKNTIIEWWQWERSKKSYKKNNSVMTANVTKKEQKVGTIQELIDEFKKQLPIFKKHFYNVREQQRQYRICIQNLKSHECAILVDFSENYNCKLTEEVQSLHFGGSKNSITLHTGMIYFETKCQSFVSISDSNCHEPHAIWAHLIPIIKLAKEICPSLSVIHFFSDGPSSQYRQKKNFFLLNLFTEKLKLSMTTWSFSESGHGKGVADGIGGATKRALDRRVLYGHDISNATDAVNNLKICMTSTKPFYIPNTDIENFKTLIPSNIKAVVGTMQIHQVISVTKNEIPHRELSCFCKRGQCMCLNPTRHYFFNDLGSRSDVAVHDSNQTDSNIETICQDESLQSDTDPLSHEPEILSMVFNDISENTNHNNTNYIRVTDKIFDTAVTPNSLNIPEMEPNITESYIDTCSPNLVVSPRVIFNDISESISQNDLSLYLTNDTIEKYEAPDALNKPEAGPYNIESFMDTNSLPDLELPRTPLSDISANIFLDNLSTDTENNSSIKIIPPSKKIKVIADISFPPSKKVTKTIPPTMNPIKIRMTNRMFYCTLCKIRKRFNLSEVICCLMCKAWNCMSCCDSIQSEAYVCAICLNK